MRVWCVANQKGGVGKTTTAMSLASGLAAHGWRALMIDLDPHASLSRWIGIDEDPAPRGTFELFGDPTPSLLSLVQSAGHAKLHLLPAQPALATLERQSANRPGLGRALVTALSKNNDFDYAVLDCPPTLGVLMVAALAAADLLIVPTQTEPLALHGLSAMVRTAEMIERSRGRPLPIAIVPSMFDKRTRAAVDSLADMRMRFGERVWDEEIPVDTRLREASRQHLTPEALDPKARGASAYARLCDWAIEYDLRSTAAPATAKAS
ncbi:MAG: Chromosome partitioning protein ParA [Alphaproteobacteria bacterium ADurb.BinA280]|jgi:chromosome partitioning protein|nr:ParA family protein [Xanthomonadales bacterium]MCC6504964.1 ParA family protein [Aquimonas sp.]OPZ12970.1 MAG: Chromosome partitioning protein ParA [Alphaproteobacteria bacterium ADurb.BinA280]